jgi:cellulose 1,4-beta-cellobiosidase
MDAISLGLWNLRTGIHCDVTASGDGLTLTFVTYGQHATKVGIRLYLLNERNSHQRFNLIGKEFRFTVDVSNLPCGLNGVLYFVQMDPPGATACDPDIRAGAKYGTGYCWGQCPTDLKFINGIPKSEVWKPQRSDKKSGNGKCTPHVCDKAERVRCNERECGCNVLGEGAE